MGISACGKSPLRFTKVTACVGRGWSMESMDRPLSSASQTLPPLMPTAGRVWRGPHTRSWPFIWEEHSITHNQALRHDWKAREHFNLRETGNLGASWCNCPHLAVKQFCVGLNETMFNCWIDTLCWLSSCAFSSCKYRKQGQPSNREQREWGVALVYGRRWPGMAVEWEEKEECVWSFHRSALQFLRTVMRHHLQDSNC